VPDLHDAAIERGFAYVRWHGLLDTLRAVLGRIPADAALSGIGQQTRNRAYLLLLERNPDSLLSVLRDARVEVFESQSEYVPVSLCAAWAHGLRGDFPAARAAFEQSRVLLDSVVQELPNDWRVHAALGFTLAGLGRRNDALREARWLQESEVYRDDAYSGPNVAEARAQILAQVSDTEGALDEIERLLGGPSYVTVHTLRLDPLWDPLRDNPRFQALVAKTK
jgi:hypothetical protein